MFVNFKFRRGGGEIEREVEIVRFQFLKSLVSFYQKKSVNISV